MELGYARVSTKKQDLDRQIDALQKEGIPANRIYTDKKTGKDLDRPGLTECLKYAREGDAIVVYTLDRLGRTLRDTLNMVHDLRLKGIGVRNLADPIRVDTSKENDAMADMAMKFLLLFADMERVYMLERAAHARAVATANGKRVGRPSVVDPTKLEHAALLRDRGHTMADIVAKTGIKRSSLYRHLPPRPQGEVQAESQPAGARG